MRLKNLWINRRRFNFIPIFLKLRTENDLIVNYGFQLIFLWFTIFIQITKKNKNGKI